jgi:AAA15 family ATPase/GTPase
MLKRVKIQGYKSLADVEVHLQPLNVLSGPNASEKSNFLDALQLLSRIATSRKLQDAFNPPYRGTQLESFAFGTDGIQSLRLQEKASFSIEIDLELSQPVKADVNQQIQEIEDEMNLEYLENTGDSLSKLLKELRQTFQAWIREDQKAGNN